MLRIIGEDALKKLLKNKNRICQSANNHKIPRIHKLYASKHIVSKGLEKALESMASIYREIGKEFEAVDLIDLEFYERWLNGRY